jgi:CBS domain-containing protein
MKVGAIMSESPVTVRATDTIARAIALMLDRGISGLPVVDAAGALVGIVTEGDLLRRVETGTLRSRPRWLETLIPPGRLAEEYVHTHGRRVEDVMSPDVVSVPEDAPLDDVVKLMERRGIKRVPVTRAGALVGIVTRANLLQALASIIDFEDRPEPTDERIRKQILNEMRAQPWAPRTTVTVIVHDGNVDLWGTLLDERERAALRVIVENVHGVKAIRDHLAWVEPLSGTVVAAPDDDARA